MWPARAPCSMYACLALPLQRSDEGDSDRALMQAAFSKDQLLVQGVELYLLAVASPEGSAEVLLEVWADLARPLAINVEDPIITLVTVRHKL